ncbi:CoA transferase [Sphingomonas sp. KC8]|uniref:CoA transferase n=1 Tax=Sphingomonas sp. KC8 TaxID=1030157 RepID=UPI000248A3A8|nr:CoA transferase [Sphingomonas sp. KC8]ARS29496.1 hypothetical protein KC8_19695 [Sphingomonas sp. KC8]
MQNLLHKIPIIEASSFVAAPTAGLYCAQFGAEVIRVDQIGGGPDYRRWPVTKNNDSLYWENLNRAKKSVAVDLGKSEGRELLVRLIQETGNFITNFPAGGFLAHDRLAAGRPDLVTVRVMGWPDGKIALDYTVNNAVGFPDMAGPGPDPVNQVVPAWDLLTGAYAAFALISAVRHRELTGAGGEIRVPLSDVAVGTAANLGNIAEVLYNGANRDRLGNGVYGLFGRDFITRDGKRLMIVVVTPKQWRSLIEALGIAADVARIEADHCTSFATDDGERFRHRDALYPLFSAAIGGRSHANLALALDAAGCVHGLYRTMLEAANDARLVGENPMFAVTSDNPSGFTYPAAGSFASSPQQDRTIPRPAPRNGQHSEEILCGRLGLSSGEFGGLVDRKIVGTAD